VAVVWCGTREDVKRAPEIKETARNNVQVDRAAAGATDSVEDLLGRRFYPELDTRAFDWPIHVDRGDGSRVVSLGCDELISLEELTVNGVLVDPAHYTLLPVNERLGPYTAIELDSTVVLAGDTERRAVEAAGAFGFWDQEAAAGALAVAVADPVTTSVTVTSSALVGVGQLLLAGTERMIVDRKSMVDTGQNTAGALTQNNNDEQLPVGSGAAFGEDEVIMVDAEKMLVVDIAGDTLVVKRAWDGSTLAAHDSGVDIYSPRRLTVRRGVLGTTAAAHGQGVAITKHRTPDLVHQLWVAEALVGLAQEGTTYGRKVGTGDAERDAAGAGIEDLRTRARKAFGRKKF
jgi:hypothetical protein